MKLFADFESSSAIFHLTITNVSHIMPIVFCTLILTHRSLLKAFFVFQNTDIDCFQVEFETHL